MFKKILFLSSLICLFLSGIGHAQVLPSTLIVSNVLYNASGQMTQVNYGNGNITTYLYNSMQRLTQLKTVNASNAAIQDLNYTYDAVGNILSITDNVNTADQTFQYDHLNRLTQAIGQIYGTKNYSYNSIGNITSKDGLTYTYDGIAGGEHAVTSLSDGTTFTYDANGNMATMQKASDLTQYYYDTENHLTEVKKNNVVVEDYTYDGDGGRTKKLPNGATPATKFIGEMYDEQGTRKTEYIFLGDQRIGSISNGNLLYYHGDHLGSANLVTSSTGVLKELSEYEPYGKFSKHEKYGTADEEAWHYFTNQYLDEATDLYYYGARYYSPLIGRFLTADSIIPGAANPQNFNRYSYVLNNPLIFVDPTGHWFALVFAVVKAVVSFAVAHPYVFSGIVGAVGNVATNPNAFSSVGSFVSSAAIGYTAGVAGYATGGPLGAKIGGFWGAVAGGAVGGATAGFITGAGNTVAQGGTLNEAMRFGIISAGYSAVTSAAVAGAGYGIGKAVQSIRQAQQAKLAAGTQQPIGEQANNPTRSLDIDKGAESAEKQALKVIDPQKEIKEWLRPLEPQDLGINSSDLKDLTGMIYMKGTEMTVRVDMINGTIKNPFGVIRNLMEIAKLNNADTLRVEAIYADGRLLRAVSTRYNVSTNGAIDTFRVDIQK